MSDREGALAAGIAAGSAGLATFLLIHAIWIVPIWFIAPIGWPIAAMGGAAVGLAFDELRGRRPRRLWDVILVIGTIVVVFLPAFLVGQVFGPIYSIDADGGGTLLIPGPEALGIVVFGLLLVTTVAGAAVGWLIGRGRGTARSMALAAFVLAIGPGHNIPLLGGTPAVTQEAVILAAVVVVSSFVLVGAHAMLTRPS